MSLLKIDCRNTGDIDLPREVSRLYDLAYNLWWAWNPAATVLFSRIDAAAWARYRNPVQVLINVDPARWDTLLEEDSFLESYGEVIRAFDDYMAAEDTWFSREHPEAGEELITYFSMEYGLHHSLAFYSGGLGVLSGDHCKSASDLGLPFVAVGLLYRHGYFHQTVDSDGVQQHNYPEADFRRLPLRPVVTPTGKGIRISVPLKDREVHARIWLAQVGRIPLLLLDTDIPANDPSDRPITDILYVNGREMRLVQEMVLGVGGVRVLRALGIEPTVWHLNEGHCAFLQLERLREQVAEGRSWPEARKEIRKNAVFTTHTPVPAGNEQFDAPLALSYLEDWAPRLGVPAEQILALGSRSEDPTGQNLNLTALALRTTRAANGVSRLNGEIADSMWRHLFPKLGPEERAVIGITNGIHSPTWLGVPLRRLFEKYVGSDWQELLLEPQAWEKIHTIPDGELMEAHLRQKERLARFLRRRLQEQLARHGEPPATLRAVEGLLDPKALTIGFARRFATYKRANLVFSDLERLTNLVTHPRRPVQLVFAGKAHPADRPGQELIQSIVRLSQSPDLEGRVFFIEDYDMRVGAMMVQGVDVWLNTPRRPMEASGTSGQKAAMNGALNFSILDGWWPEAFDGANGWAIGHGEVLPDERAQDEADALAFYETLEREVIPAYYRRDDSGWATAWIGRMKRSIASVTPIFSSHRMVRDYVHRAYLGAPGSRERGGGRG